MRLTCGGETRLHMVGVTLSRRMTEVEEKGLRKMALYDLTDTTKTPPTPTEALEEIKAQARKPRSRKRRRK